MTPEQLDALRVIVQAEVDGDPVMTERGRGGVSLRLSHGVRRSVADWLESHGYVTGVHADRDVIRSTVRGRDALSTAREPPARTVFRVP